eukprot:6202811-Pleurochrysis_carterae.AAC.2
MATKRTMLTSPVQNGIVASVFKQGASQALQILAECCCAAVCEWRCRFTDSLCTATAMKPGTIAASVADTAGQASPR